MSKLDKGACTHNEVPRNRPIGSEVSLRRDDAEIVPIKVSRPIAGPAEAGGVEKAASEQIILHTKLFPVFATAKHEGGVARDAIEPVVGDRVIRNALVALDDKRGRVPSDDGVVTERGIVDFKTLNCIPMTASHVANVRVLNQEWTTNAVPLHAIGAAMNVESPAGRSDSQGSTVTLRSTSIDLAVLDHNLEVRR